MPVPIVNPAVEALRSLPAPGAYLCGLTWDGTYLWHSDQQAGRVYALDPDDGTVLHTVACPGVRADLTFHGGRLWQIGERPKRFLVLDPRTGEVVERRAIRPSNGRICGAEARPEGIWVCLRRPAVVQLRSAGSVDVLKEFPVAGNPSGLTEVDGVVYYTDFEDVVVRGYDVATGEQVFSEPATGSPTGLTYDGRYLWYCDFPGRALRAIAPLDRGARP
ncbi:PQQ-like beta-propeller repeat protein [Amycolatopsis rhizosphaerae]|uniref:PQQ-like beta-propeller repeat protein n=1 Tax=Amycolatopsis rhizosphaerae TaxID=2053003 RepID=A0A558BKM3_9PSEU|nr:PQQ-binding-like beta-propeller repeat protein [Amycolatopsis rhizosphaerae]TVT37091.1 PQQ-like beta-propeller repeat protein [Amycolatopsis rhizosphaerae]